MTKRTRIKIEDISRLMIYILGHKPHEFGLVPDPEGFFTFKELLQAIHEEPGWGYVRQGNINEVLMGSDRSLFQFDEKRIRALENRWHMDLDHPARLLPKILFTGIRRKAHPVALEKGLRAIEGRYHVLSPNREMAERIGRRRDQKPVILEVTADAARGKGVQFYPFGDLFLTSGIPAEFITGPALPREYIKTKEKRPKEIKGPLPDFQAGTFSLKVERDMDKSRRSRGKKEKGWKEEARKYRRKR
jgi:putative RNA 2'-phosphotransferase